MATARINMPMMPGLRTLAIEKQGTLLDNLFGAGLPILFILIMSFNLNVGTTYDDIKSSPVRLEVAHKLIALPLAIMLSIYYFTGPRHPRFKMTISARTYLLYVGVALLSLATSSFFMYSAYKWVEFTTAIMTGVAVARRYGPERTVNIILLMFKICIWLVWVGVLIMPSEALMLNKAAYEGRLIPVLLNGWWFGFHNNTLGLVSAMLILIAVRSREPVNPGKKWAWIGFLTVTMILAQSRTSVAALVLAYMLTVRDKKTAMISLLVVMVMGGAAYAFGDVVMDYLTHGKGLASGSNQSLSGRLDMWPEAIKKIQTENRWALGFGFAAGPRAILESLNRGYISTLHGDPFDALASVGIAGPVLINLAMAFAFMGAFARERGNPNREAILGIITCLWVRSWLGATVAIGLLYPALFMATMLCLGHNKKPGAGGTGQPAVVRAPVRRVRGPGQRPRKFVVSASRKWRSPILRRRPGQ